MNTLSDSSILHWADAWPAGEEPLAILERCLAGDEAAYALLYRHYASYIYRLAYGLLQHREDAEEVLQDSFEYAFRRLAHYDPQKAAFKTWLYQIAVSRCRNKRRRRWLPTLSLSQTEHDELADPHLPAADEGLLLNEREQLVWAALRALSPKLRETALLRYYEGLTYEEIGQILSIPAKTAESRMRLAHKTLYQLLANEDLR